MTKKIVTTTDAAGFIPEQLKAAQPGPKGKLGILVALLRRNGGATLAEMTAATGWQTHSVRGAIAGELKKKRGIAVLSEKGDHSRVYRIAEVA